LWSCLHDVQIDAIGFDGAVFKFHFSTASKIEARFYQRKQG
jgi:hypothetical protein